jgi:LmbE family N-acetylglucosaminyl deacetylase
MLALQAQGKRLPLGGFSPSVPLKAGSRKAMGFAPHPDDMEIGGTLPVKLHRQLGMEILSVAVTLGSNKARRPGRLAELRNAHDFLGYTVVETQDGGLEKVNPKGRESDPENWSRSVRRIAELIGQHRPEVVIVPHGNDFNSTHIGTNMLVMEALAQLGTSFACVLVQTEFWFPLANPNLMLEVDEELAADLIGAVSFHVGEVERNPYHLTVVPWMIDNVRRSELVLGIGAPAPPWEMAVLLRIDHWTGNAIEPMFEGGRLISASDTDAFAALFAN